MFGQEPEATQFTPDIMVIVKKFVSECEEYARGFSAADHNVSGETAYVLMQKLSIMKEDGKSVQKYLKHDDYKGRPNVNEIATMLYKHSTCRVRLVWYAFGGNTQGKGGRIIRSDTFDWINENPVEEAEVGASALGNISEGNVIGLLQSTLAVSESHRESERREFMNAILTEREKNDERIEFFIGKITDLVDTVRDAARDMMTQGIEAHHTAHGMRVAAMRMESDALRAERRAIMKEEEAIATLADAEKALEEGETKGWQGLIQMLITTDGGQQMLSKLFDRIMGVIDTKLLGSTSKALQGLGMKEIGDFISEVNLTPEQTAKAMELMNKHFGGKKD